MKQHVAPISVAISTRHRAAALARCLDALAQGDVVPAEIVIVDQSGDDLTQQVVAAQPVGPTVLVYIHHNGSGLGVSQNIAITHTSMPVVAVTDDDCCVAPDWVATLAQAFARDDIDALTGRVLPLGPDQPGSVPVSTRTSTTSRVFGRDALAWDIGSGNNFAMRRTWFDRVGGNDERLGPGAPGRGGLDMDLFHRLLRAGARTRYEPAALVYHERTDRQGRMIRREPYGYGMGACCVLWFRQGDRAAPRILFQWLKMRGWRLLGSLQHREWTGVEEELLVLKGTCMGVAYGLRVESAVPLSNNDRYEPYRATIKPVDDTQPRPRWSVMIPTYNCAGYLRETLASVLAQDPGPALMQIEVVDDASTKDDPEAVVAELGQGRVEFFRQPRNLGHTHNFNTCLQRARGELVHLLHGDDQVREGFYQAMQRAFDTRPDIGAAFCRYIAMNEQGHWQTLGPLEQGTRGVIDNWLERIAVGQRLQTPSIVVRRAVYEQVGGFDSRMRRYGEDWEMWVRIAARYPVWYETEPLALYRIHSDSLSGQTVRTGENAADLRRAIAINRAHLPTDHVEAWSQQAAMNNASACVRRAHRMLMVGELRGSFAQLREALRFSRTPVIGVRVAGCGVLLAAQTGRLVFKRVLRQVSQLRGK